MLENPNAMCFVYRTPRYSFPLTLHAEIVRAGTSETIAVKGIDIGAGGIAIAVSEQVPVDEPVELAIRTDADELVRVPGRVLYRSEDHCGFAFGFSSGEQSEKIQDLISDIMRLRL
jgi:hypothetical protein